MGIVTLRSGNGGGDYAGAIGDLFKVLIALVGVALIGEAAAIAALYRGERLPWLSILGALTNAALLVPGLLLLLRAISND